MGIDKTKIRDELVPEVRSYADNTPLADKDTLDCSLGINPYGFPDVVIDIVHSFDVNRLYQYPHSDEAQEAVVKYWQDYAFIEPENVVMTDGSICKTRSRGCYVHADIYRHGRVFANDGYESSRSSE